MVPVMPRGKAAVVSASFALLLSLSSACSSTAAPPGAAPATIYWTGMRVLDQAGKRHHGIGVLPDILASPSLAGLRANQDEVLERGLRMIREAR